MIPGIVAGYPVSLLPPPGASAFFASDPMLSTAWGQVTFPAAIHVAGTNTTYVCWQFVGLAGYKGVHVAAYDHSTGTWGERYTAGNFYLPDDDHGDAVLLRDADGYIHCFFGSHSTGQKWSVTNAPDDISGWTQQPDIGATATYPKPVLVGSTIYLFARERAVSSRMKQALATMTPTAGLGTWSAFSNVVDFGSDSRVYTAEAHAVGTDIHFVCAMSNSADTYRRGVYYFIYDTTNGSLKNFDGTAAVSAGSLPVQKAQADADFIVFDHGSNDGDLGSFQFDSSGNAHIIFADGSSPDYDLKHVMLSSGSWSAPVTVDSIPDGYPSFGFVANYTLVRGASGEMEAWYNNSGGDKIRKVRSAGGTWGAAETIIAAGSLAFLQSNAVKDANAGIRTIFAENSGTTTDTGAVPLSMYAYGDGGGVTSAIDMTPVDPAGFSNVSMLLNCNGRNGATSVIDDSPSSVRMAFAGNAQISTAQSPFAGGASLRLDGTGDYLTALDNAAYSVAGTGDFAFDAWVRPNETGRLQMLVAKRPTSGGSEYFLDITAANQIGFIMFGAAGAVVLNLTGTTTIATGSWRFIEVCRAGGTVYLFIDGNLEASGAQSGPPVPNSFPMLIGRDPTTTARNFNGWIAEPRFTRAARHTAGYSVPTTWHPRR